jgi:hypothetical protein
MYFWWWNDGVLGQGLEPCFFDALMFLDFVSFGRKENKFFGEVVVFWHQYLNISIVNLRPFETVRPFVTKKNINPFSSWACAISFTVKG